MVYEEPPRKCDRPKHCQLFPVGCKPKDDKAYRNGIYNPGKVCRIFRMGLYCVIRRRLANRS